MTFNESFSCQDEVTSLTCEKKGRSPFDKSESHEGLFKAGCSSHGTVQSKQTGSIRTSDGAIVSDGENQSILVSDNNSRHDICALKSTSSDEINIHK